ncbi:peptide ABC transporter substrate-binding protein [Sedimentibacter sp. zth1]|uniref:peptide ABC transporter substrate-binding protein n=1 Tax=Sedimentibacter sp. zth1 TaxID=2816908 RepID=UPI001A928516|nr:peptide ABC transporter substrate-binding protein [Sedimentibacter sp. zth1]QSX04713.1 peptide ABC transporter substrate-binding protein [Sedimentibacter sp. zth1]
MKKILAILIVFTMLLALPVGCGKEMSTTYLKWNIGAEPKTFDPALNNAVDGGHVIANTFEGLLIDTREGMIAGQAKKYEVSDDGTVYTFHLRDDIKWSDGQPVKAQDFEYAWKRVCAPETSSEYSFIMAPYLKNGMNYLNKKCSADEVGVKALDEKTLEVTLENACSYFPSLVSFYTYMPVRQDIIEQYGEGWDKNPESYICNGPFVLEEYQIGSHIKLKKNENYYDAKNVNLAGIKGDMITESTTALNAYQAGDIQVNDLIPSDEIPRLQAEDPNFHITAQVATYYAMFNCDKAPMNDIRVRKAFTLAIDRKQICEQVTKGGELPATGIIPSNLYYSDGSSCRTLDENGNCVTEFDIDPNKASIEMAQQLLADAGYPNGEGFPTITYIYNTHEDHQKIAETLQEMWKNNLGINVELANEEWAVFQDTRRDGNFDIARGGWLGDYPEPMTMLDLYTSYSGNNDCQWRWNEQPVVAPHDKILNPENKAFDEAIAEAMITTGKEKDAAYKKAESVLMNDYILMPMYYYTNKFVIDEAKVEGVERTRMDNWIFKNAEMVE